MVQVELHWLEYSRSLWFVLLLCSVRPLSLSQTLPGNSVCHMISPSVITWYERPEWECDLFAQVLFPSGSQNFRCSGAKWNGIWNFSNCPEIEFSLPWLCSILSPTPWSKSCHLNPGLPSWPSSSPIVETGIALFSAVLTTSHCNWVEDKCHVFMCLFCFSFL